MRWAAGFVNAGAGGVFVTYEQIHPHDAFGQVTLALAAALFTKQNNDCYRYDEPLQYNCNNDNINNNGSNY